MTFMQAIRLAFRHFNNGGIGKYVLVARNSTRRRAMKTLIRRKFGLEAVERTEFFLGGQTDSYSQRQRTMEREEARRQRREDNDRLFNPFFEHQQNRLSNLCAEAVQTPPSRNGAIYEVDNIVRLNLEVAAADENNSNMLRGLASTLLEDQTRRGRR